MRAFPLVLAVPVVLSALACTGSEPAPAPPASVLAPPPSAPAPAPPSAYGPYVGSYVGDTSVCALEIELIDQGGKLTFRSGRIAGDVVISKQPDETYLTFVGLKGASPPDDVQAAFMDGKVVIQNSGNAMNPYTRFAQCDAKYLELVKQAPK